MTELIARWETEDKGYWYELYKDSEGTHYWFKGDNCGGSIGTVTLDCAIAAMVSKIARTKIIETDYKRVL